jgi:tetratricopeptide (TPR) repeat protein
LAQRGEWQAAIRRLEQSLAVFRDAQDVLGETQSLNELGNIHQALGENQKAETYYRQALPKQRRGGDRRQEAITLNNLAVVLGDQGQVQEAFETLQASLDLLREVGTPDEVGRALLNLGRFAKHLGQVESVGDYYREALAVLEEVGDLKGLVYAFNGLGNYYKQRGDLERSADYYTRSLRLAQQIGDLQDQEQALGNLGTLYHQRGAWDVAEGYYRQAAELCEGLGDVVGAADWWGNLALVLGLQERHTEVLPLLERQLTLYRRLNKRSSEGTALLNLAVHHRDVGDLDLAERHFTEALAVAHEVQRPVLEARVQAAWGSVRWRQARFAEAQTMFERALTLYRSLEDLRGQLTALYKLAGMHYEQENWEVARAFAEGAWAVGQRLDIPYWHGRLCWLLGEIILELEDDSGADYLAKAALFAQRATDDQRYRLSIQSILERVTMYSEAGYVKRALAICRRVEGIWKQEPTMASEALTIISQVRTTLEHRWT